ncbi:acetylxylan esterase [Catenovulum sp. 2E275]|uniref:acetylxylan esterase n=1 Tax=Catenovulum sp. 2E275 TaxID=2980497 RepID=UPI0021D2781B|nr:acetylxylan esterase [Catenovulum sp. 2E275]MCU4677161.1 acetylxylan esterase [Catenovulum sp. 2E275]
MTQLLNIQAPAAPTDFLPFWQQKYQQALSHAPKPVLTDTGLTQNRQRIFEISYQSTNAITIRGWLSLPESGRVERGFVVGHGYGGREFADTHLPFENSAYLYLCCRGISKSATHQFSSNPAYHVLHDIDKPKNYILAGCVEDTWLAVSSLLRLYPELNGHIGYLGISFSGGIGALALSCDNRIQRAHFNVPSFGHNLIRMQLPTTGSAKAVQEYAKKHPNILTTLSYYDAAIAAKFIKIPVHIAAALFDPVVAPPGQFAIYNALESEKRLFILEAGHSQYPAQKVQEKTLLNQLNQFFYSL